MNKIILLAIIAVIVGGCKAPEKKKEEKFSAEYQLLSTIWFQKSAETKALFHQAYNIAKMRIDEIAKNKYDKPAAVVLDIDETVLDNSPFQGWCIQNDSAFSKKSWHRWVLMENAAPLTGALDFTIYAQKNNVEVIYISNRHVTELEATINNMKKLGFPNADENHIFLKDSTSDKTIRRNLVSEKFEIALLVGDNLGDFDHLYDDRDNLNAHKVVEEQKEMFGKKFIVLPNPMYGKWEKPFRKIEGGYVTNLKESVDAMPNN
eukprot:Anaeramoba_ignava/a224346_4.p1 GENE.a224346_4~~a224346_4.p1  ORF type:complete len:262 (-),score=36.71 a224346_4:11-796(-)